MSETIGVLCSMCHQDLGEVEHVDDGNAVFEKHLETCDAFRALR